MKLSVITSTYNAVSSSGEAELKRCLESVAKIDVAHEHIIEDGGSTDSTIEVVKNLGIQSVKIYQEKDSGIYNALNKALARANGEWVYIIGADDYVVKPEKFSELIEAAERNGAELIAAPVMTREAGSSVLPMNARRMFAYMPYPHQGVIMKRDLIERCGGFDEAYRVIADYKLEMKAILGGTEIFESSEPFAYYNTTGYSNGCDEKILLESRRMLGELLNLRGVEIERVRPRGVVPLRVVLKYLRHESAQVRSAAKFQLKRYVADIFGLIDENGFFITNRRR